MPTQDEIAFPRLTPAQLEALLPLGRCRPTTPGEILFREGERAFDFFVVRRGEVEILEHSHGAAQVVTVHGPGEFTGDVDLLTGRGALVTARVRTPGEVLQLDEAALRRVVAEMPGLGDLLLRAFLMRRSLLLGHGYQGIRIIGSRFSPAAHQLREFAVRNAIPFTWLDVEQDEEAEALLRHFGVPAGATPVVITMDGQVLRNPSVTDLAARLGLEMHPEPGAVHDLVVIGAGPAGLGAAVYAASEGLRTFVVDAIATGGQAGTSTRIENYLGFPAGITGAELTSRALLQAQRFGAQVSVPQAAVRLRRDGGRYAVVLDDGTALAARCVLVASGAEYRRLEVPGIERWEGAGVYYAATALEARLCAGDAVAVVGGGNSAGQAAVYLARFARRVHLVVRGPDLDRSMSRYLIDRIEHLDPVQVHLRATVVAVEGDEALEAVTLRAADSGAETRLPVRTLFVLIGAVPHTAWLGDCVRLDRRGFVLTGPAIPADALADAAWAAAGRPPFLLETSLPGVFAAGDVRSGSVKRVASAVGEGAMAVSFVHAHLAAAQ
ncbi:MAG TPA: FAD-dependent oxidoreductase [Gemmatimonadales bacterium]|nr:FAD-dependent oxidoreductase [Gemmatimonadales bacterium]